MVISITDIPQNEEITVSFDNQNSEIPSFLDCACDKKSCGLIKQETKETIDTVVAVKQPVTLEGPTPPAILAKIEMPLSADNHPQVESETEAGNEDARHEKLSREERKLQAYLKQFEKLEKKGDTGKQKHHKDGKQPCLRTPSLDEVPTPVNNSTPLKPCLVKYD